MARASRRAAHARVRREADYDSLLAAQKGGCAICGALPLTRRLDVDHDHRTMRVRGLLCHRCNRALPSWISPSWLLAAAAYLENPPAEGGTA